MTLKNIFTTFAILLLISGQVFAQTNVSQGKSSTASSVQGANVPGNANNGVATGARWAASDATFPQWWRVDLGSSHTLTHADINWYSTTARAYKYKIEVSADDATYNTVVNKTGNITFGDTSDTFSATGRYVRVTVTGANAGFASAYEISIFGTPAVSAPSITSTLTASGTVGTAFSYQIMASNSPTSYKATGLPADLSINTSTGLISGTPTAAGGPTTVAISATNAGGTGNANLAVTINAAPLVPPAVPTGLTATPNSTSQITVTWNPVAGATGYDLQRDGVTVANATSPNVHTGLAASSTHTYSVRAKNADGNSAYSSPVSATTQAAAAVPVALFNSSTVLEPDTTVDTPTALITRFGDRARDRHAREDNFHIYDHYL
ncbi:MAG: discoidin domain-containing protein, partial [Chthoniobacterales bacterium]